MLVDTSVYVPLTVYVAPSTDQVYVSQAVAVVVFDVLLFIVSTKVCVLSQPEALVNTWAYEPLVVYVVPFQS